MLKVTYKGVEYVQNDFNHHIAGFKDNVMVFHAQENRSLTETEFLKRVKIYGDVFSDDNIETFLSRYYADKDTEE